MIVVDLFQPGAVVPPVPASAGPLHLARHNISLSPEDLPGKLGHKLDHPDLLLCVHNAGERGRTLTGSQQRWTKYLNRKIVKIFIVYPKWTKTSFKIIKTHFIRDFSFFWNYISSFICFSQHKLNISGIWRLWRILKTFHNILDL